MGGVFEEGKGVTPVTDGIPRLRVRGALNVESQDAIVELIPSPGLTLGSSDPSRHEFLLPIEDALGLLPGLEASRKETATQIGACGPRKIVATSRELQNLL